MDKIEGVNLSELITESSQELLNQHRKGAASMIKQILQRAEGLATDIKFYERQIKIKQGKLKEQQAKIDKLRKGDWSILVEQTQKEPQKEFEPIPFHEAQV